MKTCIHCNQVKPLDAFGYKQTAKDKRHPICKDCDNKRRRFQYSLSKTQQKPIDSVKSHRLHISKKFGLTSAEEQHLYDLANNQCQVCGSTNSLKIDHNHSTHAIRGILCSNCNFVLGLVKDNPTTLLKLIQYLQNAPTTINIFGLLNSMTSRGGV